MSRRTPGRKIGEFSFLQTTEVESARASISGKLNSGAGTGGWCCDGFGNNCYYCYNSWYYNWYYWAIIGGGTLIFVAVFAFMAPRRRQARLAELALMNPPPGYAPAMQPQRPYGKLNSGSKAHLYDRNIAAPRALAPSRRRAHTK